MAASLRIGIDFDNTIICYDEVFLAMARDQNLAAGEFGAGKQALRDAIRLLPDGEILWQKLQGQVYGKGAARASMFAGVDAFLLRSRRENATVTIVSHKTEYGHYDPERVNLRTAALDWMTAQGFFREEGYAIPSANIHFAATRDEKIARIAQLGFTHFIDDLEEVLTDPAFPPGVERILFSQSAVADASAPYVVCSSWPRIEEHVFRGGA